MNIYEFKHAEYYDLLEMVTQILGEMKKYSRDHISIIVTPSGMIDWAFNPKEDDLVIWSLYSNDEDIPLSLLNEVIPNIGWTIAGPT